MKKKRKFSFVFLIILSLFAGVISAASADDFESQIKRATFYAESYEAGNVDYSKLVVYLSSVEGEINAILKSKTPVAEADLTKILGEPKKSNFVLSGDFSTEVKLENAASTWENKVLYDGDKLQIKIGLTPFLHDSGSILYEAKIESIFKKSLSETDLTSRVEKVKKLAKEFTLDSNLERANELAEESVNLEKIFPTYYQQSHKECIEILSGIFGKENLKSQKEIVSETYDLNSKNDYDTLLELSICENCVGADQKKWIGLEFRIEIDGESLAYSSEDIEENLYQDLGINGVKGKFIELNAQMKELIEAENYAQAYRVGKRMEILNDVWNQLAHEGTESEITKNFVDRVSFYNGFLEGYSLKKTSVYEETLFEKVLLREIEEEKNEICTNEIDDNSDGKIDCNDSLCSGEICGVKTIDEGTQVGTVNLYCTAGSCQEKEEEPLVVGPMCGNKICEGDEEQTCAQDCATCPVYSSINCNGIVLSKGKDANGCNLESVCLSSQGSCTTNSDCSQPLCGKSECINSKCVVQLDECNQAQCVDGEKQIQECSSSNEIITTDLCSHGVWKTTKETCTATPQVSKQVAASVVSKVCVVKEDCAADSVCSAGQCVNIASKTVSDSSSAQSGSTKQGISFTGRVVEITGEYLTSDSITGVVGEEYGQEIDETNVPERNYDGVKAFSPFTGIISNPEEELSLADEPTPSVEGTRKLAEGIKDEFVLQGICTTKNQQTQAQLSFSGGGEKFGAIDSLQYEYRKSGIEWCDWELEKFLEKRQEIEKSFDAEFAEWFFEEYLPNHADDWENKKQTILKIYSEITKNQEDIASMMNCLNLRELSTYKTLNIDYETEYGSLKYSEKVGEAKPEGATKNVFIVNPSLETSVFPSKEFIKKDLTKSKDANQFPGSVESKKERELNEGLTNLEMQKFKKNTELKKLLSEATSTLQDGYLDVQIQVVDKEDGEETVYNIYARANENEILMQPMPVEKIPPGLDAKITVDYNTLYNLLYTSEENVKETSTKYPPWSDSKFRPIETINSVGNWINAQVKLNRMMNSVEIYPQNPKVNEIFKETFFLIAQD